MCRSGPSLLLHENAARMREAEPQQPPSPAGCSVDRFKGVEVAISGGRSSCTSVAMVAAMFGPDDGSGPEEPRARHRVDSLPVIVDSVFMTGI